MVSRHRVLVWSVAAAVTLSALPAGAATNTERARAAVGYIVRQQSKSGAVKGFSTIGTTSDAVVAMVAAKRGKRDINEALNFLARKTKAGKLSDDAGVYGKVIMAVVAGDRDPRAFGGGTNLVKKLRASEQPDGSLGEGVQVFSHALGVLGLIAADAKVTQDSVQWLIDAQCGNGGWAFDGPSAPSDDDNCKSGGDDFVGADSNTTAIAVVALEAAGDSAEVDPFAYLRTVRDDDKRGWGYDQSFAVTDANSTSVVIQAYIAEGRNVPRGGMKALRGLQPKLCGRDGGGVRFVYGKDQPVDVGATVAATPALMKKPLPLKPGKVTKQAPGKKPCR